MMFLSALLIDTGRNPDRPRPGRKWLRNRYRVHQRLCMAFPSDPRKSKDRDFLAPYSSEDFSQQAHVERGKDAGFLFRVDPRPGSGRAVILVQSATEPDWDYAFRNASHLLAGPPQCKPFNPHFTKGQRLRFMLTANPTRKIDTKTGPDGRRRNGRRVPVPTPDLESWLQRRAEPEWNRVTGKNSSQSPPGFRLTGDLRVHGGYVYVDGSEQMGGGKRFRFATYEGELEVSHPDRFHGTLIRGIGPAKAFGFGLLSVAPV